MKKDTIKNWIIKAENDLKIGLNELNSTDPTTDMICFHMQQCAEKYLKAYLAFNEADIRKTHDIAVLLHDCITIDHSFHDLFDEKVPLLTPYGTVIRYPDDFYMPSIVETEEAVKLAQITKQKVIKALKQKGLKF